MTYRFGVFEFDAAEGALSKNGRAISLEPQPARALARLLAEPGEIVSREQLREAVWGESTHVDFDRGLAYCVSQIRGALGDSGENPRFVQTLPKKGFRFIAEVAIVGVEPIVPEVRHAPRNRMVWLSAAAVVVLGVVGILASGRPSRSSNAPIIVAVSIFDNETGQPQHDRMVAGLADLVVTRLSEIAPDRLAVIGNAAALRQPRNIRNIKSVASEVRADYLILGQLQTAEQGLRFVTHLIRLSDQTHLKANRIPRPDGDVTGLESAVVAEFEAAVRRHLLSATP